MRIRSVKPEFFDSPSTAACSPWARLLYIAMWCMADDWGVGSANLKEMSASAFPNDDQWTSKELPSLCKEVADNYGVLFYTHRGRRYFEIPAWSSHQVTQRRAARRHPTSDDPESVLDQELCGSPSACKEVPSQDQEKASTEQGKGNRGTGEQGNTLAQPSGSSVRRFDDFWNTYPRKVGKQKARAKYAAAAKRADEETIIAGAQRLATDPNLPERQYIPHPTTWLERDGWEDEPLPPRQQPKTFGEQKLDRINALTASYLQEGGDPWTSEPPNALPPNSSALSSATTGETTSTSLPLPHLRQA